MNNGVFGRLTLISITLLFLLSGCIWTKKPIMPVSEQNALAVQKFTEQGFESEEIDRGVIVFLPPNIYFEGSKSNIDLAAREKISQIASELNQGYLVDRNIEISGHADSNGDETRNLALSKLRAEAAAGELVFSKVDKSRVRTLWFGETKPKEKEFNSNGTIIRHNQDLNRRVEFVILNPE